MKERVPRSAPVSLRLPVPLADRIEAFITKHRRAKTAVIEHAIVEYLNKYESIPAIEELAEKRKR